MPPFVPMFQYAFKTEAWRALTPVERCVYLEIKRRYKGDNNGSIGVSARELAAEIGVSKNTANKAVHSLVDKGFVIVEALSGFNRKDRTSQEYRLTEYPNDLPGKPREATKEFMRWRKPENQNTVTSRAATVSVALPSGGVDVQKTA